MTKTQNTLNRLLKDVLENIRAQENLVRNLKNAYSTVSHEREVQPGEIFEIPQYEKDQGFSAEFRTAFRLFIEEKGRLTSNMFIWTWWIEPEQYAEGYLPLSCKYALKTYRTTEDDVIVTIEENGLFGKSKEFSLKEIDRIEFNKNLSIEALMPVE